MVRAGNQNELINFFVDESLVAIGWKGLGNLSEYPSREQIKELYRETYPDHSKNRVAVNAGQLYRFAHVMEDEDRILTYDKSSRTYYYGQIENSYRWSPDNSDEYPHVRSVDWQGEISRDEFSTPIKNTLGSTLTVFSLDEHLDKIESVLTGKSETESDGENEEDTPPYFEEVQATSEELISDHIAQLDPFDFEELVAALLRAVGYNASTTDPGPDQGVDIVAHPDALGFEEPLVKVQVKHRKSTTGGPEMREFVGTLGNAEKGLFVSTGGFTRDAEQAAESTNARVALLNRDEFIDLFLQHYEDIEAEYQAKVPLKRVYVPTLE
jgi:restriction system protein